MPKVQHTLAECVKVDIDFDLVILARMTISGFQTHTHTLDRKSIIEVIRWEYEKVHFQVKMYKTHHARTTFGGSDVEKVYAVVARSTFPSQNVQNTTCSRHFWKFKCRKSARRCGAKHISKSKC